MYLSDNYVISAQDGKMNARCLPKNQDRDKASTSTSGYGMACTEYGIPLIRPHLYIEIIVHTISPPTTSIHIL